MLLKWFRNRKESEIRKLQSYKQTVRNLRKAASRIPNFPFKDFLRKSKAGRKQYLRNLQQERKEMNRKIQDLNRDTNRQHKESADRDKMIEKRKKQIKKLEAQNDLLKSANEDSLEVAVANTTTTRGLEDALAAKDEEIKLANDIHEVEDSVLSFPQMSIPSICDHFELHTPEDIEGIGYDESYDVLRDFDTQAMQEHEDYEGPATYNLKHDGSQSTAERKLIIAKALKIDWEPNMFVAAAEASNDDITAPASSKKRSLSDLSEADSDNLVLADEEPGDFERLVNLPPAKKPKTDG